MVFQELPIPHLPFQSPHEIRIARQRYANTVKISKKTPKVSKELAVFDPDLANSTINRLAFIGNYLPRQCGIATFTTDLCEAVAAEATDTTCIAVPVNDIDEGYAYPPRVRFEITEKDIDSYRRAADFLNLNNVDLVCLQHEYGIFGGRTGRHILALLRELRMPVVTTLHTILREPDAEQQRVLEHVAALSDRLVVMSERGAEFLRDIYHVPAEKIDLIPHGIPDVPFVDPSFHKDLFGVEGKIVLLSFGLLSANKGIENVIAALPGNPQRISECSLHSCRRDSSKCDSTRRRAVSIVAAMAGSGTGRRRSCHLL